MALFSCCPTSPVKFSAVTCQYINDCARSGIPIEQLSAPISGLVAPVTCVGSLILHTAETLFGIVISQTAKPGAPVLYGGAPAIFDYRFETAPMSATESMIINCAPALGAMLDVISNCSTELAIKRLEIEVAALGSAQRQAALMYSLGYCGWPTQAQRELFTILQADQIDVRLTPGTLMLPTKSVSGVIELGDERTHCFENNFACCKSCCDWEVTTIHQPGAFM